MSALREARGSPPWALVLGLLASVAAAVALVGPASAQVPSTDATLSGITISGRAIPGFSPSVLSYAVSVGYTIDRATTIPTRNDTNATVTYLDSNDMPLTDADTGTDDQDVDLVVGDTTVKVKVTAEDTTTVLTYTVTITRTEEDTSLSPPASDPVAAFPSTAVYSVSAGYERLHVVWHQPNTGSALVEQYDASGAVQDHGSKCATGALRGVRTVQDAAMRYRTHAEGPHRPPPSRASGEARKRSCHEGVVPVRAPASRRHAVSSEPVAGR